MKNAIRWPLILFIAALTAAAAPTTQSAGPRVGEQVPSEDSVIKDLHSLGLIDGKVDIFRCASPVRDLHGPADIEEAKARMQRLYDLGIRTIVSLEDPDRVDPEDAKSGKAQATKERVALEKQAAADVGLTFVSHPMTNSGPDSLEDMSDQAVLDLLDPIAKDILERAKTGGVAFHCSAGHDRTGLVCAYMRIAYQHWSVDQAIEEMRRYGHNWVKYSNNGGISSWHEEHLRAIAKLLAD